MSREFSAQLKNPTALHYFREVAKAGSFRKAAEVTHVAASAINRQVKNLEDEVEAPLFERGRGRSGLKLTAAGEILLLHVRTIANELNAAKTQIDALKGLKRGNIRMGVNEGFARELLRETLTPFNQRHPQVTFELLVAASPRLVEMVMADEVDLIIAYNVAPHAGLQVQARCLVGSCIMVPRQHPLASKSSVRLADCAPYGFIMPHESMALRPTIDRMFASVGIQPRIALTTDSYEMMRSAASAGLGIAIVSQYLHGLDPNYPHAVFVPIRDTRVKKQAVSCCVRKGRHLSVASLTLLESVAAVLQARSER
ncbi:MULTISPECIES: LysR family transcriptional regulator [unclassified Variovorax]|jgi:DNA-binding transcriptional LysR family regulator|uniref:LysR family transcriptional regulator n=1 Tax=unclassified Variovorax TaxID=663243 RepID=UPI001AE84DEB